MRLASANAALWATGNGLISTLLVIYLATNAGAEAAAISLILAAPRFAGTLRLTVPALMARTRRRKAICVLAFLASAIVLCIIPAASAARAHLSSNEALAVLIAAWCVYHLLEYVAAVALWSWLGDLTPPRIRGRLLGQRERWLVGGRVVGLVASAALAVSWSRLFPNAPNWQPLAISAAMGAAFMMLAVVPLCSMPAASHAPSAVPTAPWRTLIDAVADPLYRRLLVFSCVFSVVNGLPAAAQEMYPVRVLGLPYFAMQGLRGLMRVGQFLVAPWAGRLTDRWGNRPVMTISQLVVATGTLFYLAASPETWWFIAGAHLVWIAYAGLNVGLDNIKLKLAPADNNAPYIAVYQALSDLMNGLTMVAGGILIDATLRAGGSPAIELYAKIFQFAWIGRTLLAGLLEWIIEPGARPLRDLL